MSKIKVEAAHSPEWATPQKEGVTLKVKFSHLKMEVLFTALPSDDEPHAKELLERAGAGEFGEVAPYSGPSAEEEQQRGFEVARSRLLATTETRITQLERIKRLGMAEPGELEELEGLEIYSVHLMRAKGPELPKSPIVR